MDQHLINLYYHYFQLTYLNKSHLHIGVMLFKHNFEFISILPCIVSFKHVSLSILFISILLKVFLSTIADIIYGLISCPVAKSISFIYPLNTTVSMLLYISLSNIFFYDIKCYRIYCLIIYIYFYSFSLIWYQILYYLFVFLYSYSFSEMLILPA